MISVGTAFLIIAVVLFLLAAVPILTVFNRINFGWFGLFFFALSFLIR